MTDEQKINMVNQIINLVKEGQSADDMPIMIGTLSQAQGTIGFKIANIGHPVFEYKGRYLLYVESEREKDGKLFTIQIPYNKKMLAPVIDFLNLKD